MIEHEVRVIRPGERIPRERELAWRLAEIATDGAPLDPRAMAVAIDRVIDNAGVAIAAINRAPAVSARAQALAFPDPGGATILGLPPEQRFQAAWAAWANGAAVRELDFHDSFFAQESGHPGDTIPPLIAVAQHCRLGGDDLLRGIVTAYEVQIDLAKGINLSLEKIDHVGHLGPAVAAGLSAMLRLETEAAYQAIQLAAHLSYAPRQSRKGEISSWKAHAPGHVGNVAIEAVDRAMRGETSPSPIYEGDYGLIAAMLKGDDAVYSVPLPELGEPKRGILETFTKEHSAGYHGQAVIDLALKMRPLLPDPGVVEEIVLHTKKFTHLVMGTGANDPEKMDPNSSRETLDHSAMFMFAVALEDGAWHHEASYAPERVSRSETVALWRKIRTAESDEWNDRFYGREGLEKDHGARAVVRLRDGRTVEEEIAVARAHPRGERPFGRAEYVQKFTSLAEPFVSAGERARFLAEAEGLAGRGPGELGGLTVAVDRVPLVRGRRKGIFDYRSEEPR
ncbi:MmgE/PrpD family protein [Faunimonas sp. B44]|uniref:MmgE/PrpD family protein n=1 Tax=Faunimonas sp. B44 TaxID=3461493 RepID=UPI004043B64F